MAGRGGAVPAKGPGNSAPALNGPAPAAPPQPVPGAPSWAARASKVTTGANAASAPKGGAANAAAGQAPEKGASGVPAAQPSQPASDQKRASNLLQMMKIADAAQVQSQSLNGSSSTNGTGSAAASFVPVTVEVTALQRGSIVRLTTILGEEIEGTVFVFDPRSRMLVLESGNSVPKDFRLLTEAGVKSALLLQPGQAEHFQFKKSDEQTIRARQEKTRHERQLEALKIGKGVSEQAQAIFDGISKTMPCHWDGQIIVVMDTVKIGPPYTVANVAGNAEQAQVRVKKVLEEVRRKLRL